MPKPRQAQKKPDGTTAIPKPTCPKCSKIMRRFYTREEAGARAYKGAGWYCPKCKYQIFD